MNFYTGVFFFKFQTAQDRLFMLYHSWFIYKYFYNIVKIIHFRLQFSFNVSQSLWLRRRWMKVGRGNIVFEFGSLNNKLMCPYQIIILVTEPICCVACKKNMKSEIDIRNQTCHTLLISCPCGGRPEWDLACCSLASAWPPDCGPWSDPTTEYNIKFNKFFKYSK